MDGVQALWTQSWKMSQRRTKLSSTETEGGGAQARNEDIKVWLQSMAQK
jgi:hypothetical protein